MISNVIWIVLFLFALFAFRLYHLAERSQHGFPKGTVNMGEKEMEKEWHDLSWSGADPFRVIALARQIGLYKSEYEKAKLLASSYYSQVKYLAKKGKVASALVFYAMAYRYRNLALVHSSSLNMPPIDLEVLGAPDFMLASLPLAGKLFKGRALRFLLAANQKAEEQALAKGSGYKAGADERLVCGIIWSKLYALTGDNTYRVWVLESAWILRQSDSNQITRIAKHLGFKTKEELCKHCTM